MARSIVIGSCRTTTATTGIRGATSVHGGLVYYPDEIAQLIRYLGGTEFAPTLLPTLFLNHDPWLVGSQRDALRGCWNLATRVLIEVSMIQRLVLSDGLFATARLLHSHLPPGSVREKYDQESFERGMDLVVGLCGTRKLLLVPVFQFPDRALYPALYPPVWTGPIDHAPSSRVTLRDWLRTYAERRGIPFWDQTVLTQQAPPSVLYKNIYHYTDRGTELMAAALKPLLESD